MDKKELVITTTKELLLKMMDTPGILKLRSGGEDAVADLGDRFKTLSGKIEEALFSKRG